MSFESLVEVTFLQHQNVIFFGDFSPAGHNQRTEEQELHHSCGKCRQWITGEICWALFWVFFTPLVKVWESSWYFVSTATNVAQARRKQRGVSGSAHAHLSGRKQFVLKCDWTAAACTWKWMTALLLARPHGSAGWLITHRSRKTAPQTALRACGLIAHKRGSNVLSVLFRCAIYSSSATNLIC